MKTFTIAVLLLIVQAAYPQCYNKVQTNGQATIGLHDGSLWAWGLNSSGTLGLGPGSFSTIFPRTQIGTADDWSATYCITTHVLALKNDGRLWAWGANLHGQCGNGTSGGQNYVLTPQQVGADSWIAVAAGSDHSLAIKANGTLWAWGLNDRGQLGNGNQQDPDQLVPLQIGADTDWTKVFSYGKTSFAIKADGTLWSWGDDGFNTLLGYNATVEESKSPHQVGTAADWSTVAPYYFSVMATKNDGSLWVWGRNSDGAYTAYYGNGETDTNDYANNPTRIGNQSDWQSVATSQYNFRALKTDGTIWGWGRNTNGVLGDGTAVDRYVPVQIGTASDWIQLSASGINTFALNASHSLYHWGFIYGVGSLSTPSLNGAACTELGTANVDQLNTSVVFPNPTHGNTTIRMGNGANTEIDISVSDMLGQILLKRKSFIGTDREIQLDLGGYASGLYLLTIRSNNQYYQTKINKI